MAQGNNNPTWEPRVAMKTVAKQGWFRPSINNGGTTDPNLGTQWDFSKAENSGHLLTSGIL